MGHIIRSVAENLGHQVVLTVDVAANDADVVVPAGDAAALSNAVASSNAEYSNWMRVAIDFWEMMNLIGSIKIMN